jgi:hypothetical protein
MGTDTKNEQIVGENKLQTTIINKLYHRETNTKEKCEY